MTFDRRRSELEARSLRRLDLPRVYHENQIAELDAHNSKLLVNSSISCGVLLAMLRVIGCCFVRAANPPLWP